MTKLAARHNNQLEFISQSFGGESVGDLHRNRDRTKRGSYGHRYLYDQRE